jgi:UDP-3-O-[3-hydroxymyristoyl] glucosamine N-acyltransferase
VIGYDGFGFHTADGVHRRVPHLGNVVIEDDVEIDACTCVDRAKFGSTRIGQGAKIDNKVQIAHNCRIGAGSIIAGGSDLAGSVTMGRYCIVAGRGGIRDGVTLGDGARIGAGSVALRDVGPGVGVLGFPARPAEETMRVWPAMKKLPGMLKRMRKLESRLAALERDKAKDD